MTWDASYPALKRLVESPDWRIYETILDEVKESIVRSLELGSMDPLEAQIQLKFLTQLRGRPHIIIKEVEEKHDANR